MAQPPKQEAVIKELVAVVGRIKKVEGTVTQGNMVITEDLLMVMSEIKSVLKHTYAWSIPPSNPVDLVAKNNTEYAVLLKLRVDATNVSNAAAAKLAKKVQRT